MKRWGYVLVFFLTAFSLGLLLPIMSLIFTGKGGTVKELSIGLSILSATVILLELPSGLFADLFGRRDTFCWSVIFQITSLFLCLSASFPVLYAGMALMGVGKALGSGSLEALFTDRYIEAYGKERLHQAVTARTISESTGIAMGSLLGAFLMRQSQRLFGVSEIGRISILTAIGSCVAGLILCLLLIPRDNGSFAPSGSDASGRDVLFAGMDKQFSACIHEIRRNRNLVFLLILILFTGMFLSNTERFWQVTLEARLPDKQLLWLAGVLSFFGFIMTSAGSFSGSKAIGRGLSGKSLYFFSRIALFVGLNAMALLQAVTGYAAAYIFVYLFVGLGGLAESVLVNSNTPSNVRASMLSVYSLTIQAGSLLASAFAVPVVNRFGISGCWMVTAALLLFSTLLFVPPIKSLPAIRNLGKPFE